MLIIPAIDIKDGKCVRLHQGRMETAHIYYEDPTECADYWIEQGARRLHLVDLDAAVTAKNTNRPLLDELIYHLTQKHRVQVQIGGGIRAKAIATHYLEEGAVNYIIIGTWALQDPEAVCDLARAFPRRIYLGLDVKNNHIYVRGWTQASELTIKTALAPFESAPLAGIVMTDIERDGTLRGIRIQPFLQMRAATKFPIIAAGGIHTMADIISLKDSKTVNGAICGKALYERTLDLKQALQLIKK